MQHSPTTLYPLYQVTNAINELFVFFVSYCNLTKLVPTYVILPEHNKVRSHEFLIPCIITYRYTIKYLSTTKSHSDIFIFTDICNKYHLRLVRGQHSLQLMSIICNPITPTQHRVIFSQNYDPTFPMFTICGASLF